jgi:serine protease Do
MTTRMLLGAILVLAAGGASAPSAGAQDRDAKVRGDRDAFAGSAEWVYNDLDAGRRAARASGKPMLVVFRCIPCEACKQFDEDVARRDPVVRDLMDQFVCVRIVQANTIDLAHFQHDFDQSFAAYLTDAELTIYARYGTRSERPESRDVSLEGLGETMTAALGLHADGRAERRAALAGKQVRPDPRFRTPADYPSLAGKYGATLDYEGKVAQSCLHCHQVREAEREVYRSSGAAIRDEVLFPYPDPATLGLTMDPKAMATVEHVTPGSIAARDGLRAGDEIVTFDAQPLLSIADLQWVLHNAPAAGGILAATVRRGDEVLDLAIDLPGGWRHAGNISWRATTWDLRRMGLGGMWLQDLTDDERAAAGLPKDGMALRARHVGEYGEHAVALRAGLRKDDVVVAFDGQAGRVSESELLAYALQRKRPGDEVAVTVLRGGERTTVRIALQ